MAGGCDVLWLFYAPYNGLKLFHALLLYADVHPQISQSAIFAFKRHLWHSSEAMAALALFSSEVPAAERRALAEIFMAMKSDTVIIKSEHRFGTGYVNQTFLKSLHPQLPCQILRGLIRGEH